MTTTLPLPIGASNATACRRLTAAPQPVSEWRVISSRDRAEAMRAWHDVEARFERASSPAPLAVSTRWTNAWLQTYGDAVPHEFVVLLDAQGPVGISLVTRGLTRGLGPLRFRSRHLGTAGERHGESVCVEYNGLLVLPEHLALFQERLVAHLLRDKSWESLCVDGFSEPAFHELARELPGFEVRYRDCPWYDLAAARETGGDIAAGLGRSTRQNVRRLLRKYEGVRTEWAESADQALDILSELESLHQARWRSVGQPGAFHRPRFASFQRTLLQTSFEGPASRRAVALFRVQHGGQTIGCLMLLRDGPRLLDYLSGFADFSACPSPGVVTHVLCMQAALERGFDAYDFLVGEKRHKANLSTNVNRLVWAAWNRPSVKGRIIHTLRTLKKRWKDWRRHGEPAQPPDSAA